MQSTTINTEPSIPVTPATPVAGEQGMAMPAATPAPATTTAPVQTAQRGHFFSGIDWTEVLMMGIVVFTLGMSIYASRQQIQFVRAGKKSISQDIDEIKSNLQTVMGDQYQPYTT